MEHAPHQSYPPPPETVLRVAKELFGENSQRVSDIQVIFEEGIEDEEMREKLTEEAIFVLSQGVSRGEIRKPLLPYEMAEYLKQLRFPPARIDNILHATYPEDYPDPKNLPNYGRPDKLHS